MSQPSRPISLPSSGRATVGAPPPERVPWEELGPEFMAAWGSPRGEWMPEHLEILGQTGSGKSYFEKIILSERVRLRGAHVVVIATKPADKTLTSLHWPIVTKWPPSAWKHRDKRQAVIYWAKAKGLGPAGKHQQRLAVADLLEQLWKPDSNIIVAFDEIAYIEQDLGLRTHVQRYYREARALGITIVASTQRPQGVSRYMHSESTWSVFFSPKDEEDAERMAQVAGAKRYYKDVLLTLDRTKYEFLLVHNLTGERYISHISSPRIEPNKKIPSDPVEKRDASTH